MRTVGVFTAVLLIALLGMAASATAQCTAVLADGLFPTGGAVQVGDTIEYMMTVSVPNVYDYCTLYDVSLYFFPPPGESDPCDNMGGGVLIASGLTLTPGGPVYTFTSADNPALAHVVTLADMTDADGHLIIADMATAFYIEGGTGEQQCDESSSVVYGTNPCIDIDKDACGFSKVGDEIVYTICITNCSNPPAPLYNIVVTDPLLGGSLAGFPSGLEPGEQVCVDFPYIVQSGDPDPLVNTAEVMGEDVYGNIVDDSDGATVDLLHPSFEVDLECITVPVPAGGTADIDVEIVNTGDVDLLITTDHAQVSPFTLYVGQTYNTTVYTDDPGGVECIFDEINVTATLPPEFCDLPNILTGYDDVCCPVSTPCIEVTKDVNCDISKVGDEVIYTICVTNCSEPPAPLYNVVVSDPMLEGVVRSTNKKLSEGTTNRPPEGLAGFPSTLAPGESVCVDFPYTVQEGDPDPLENTVSADGESEFGIAAPTVYATEYVDLIHPSFTVDLECMTDPVAPGGDADFLVTIVNTGDADLLISTDEAAVPPFTLYVGDTSTTTMTVTDPGGVDCVFGDINVTATIPPEYCNLPNVLEEYADACCPIDGPAIEITKEVDCDISSEGDEVIYTICVTNLSNPPATLYNVVVTDPLLGGTLAGFPSELSPGQNVCVDFPYTIQSGDPDPLENRVDVDAESSYGTAVSDYAEETVDLIHPSFTVTKECLTDPVPAGGDADFLITITNTGDWDLWIETDEAAIAGFALYASDPVFTQTVTVTDPGGVDCVFNAINVTATLYPDECEIGTELTGYAEACCNVDGPAIEITKEVDCDISSEGDEVIYTICVTNLSNPPATLYNVVVTDPLLGGTLAGFPSELSPGQNVCVDFPYTIQSGDPDPLDNTVTVNAESEYGTAVSDYAEETVDLIHPSFTVTKECLTDPVPAGGDADFLITITNTGDWDLWIETDEAAIAGFALYASDPVFTQTVTVTDPGGVDCVFNAINVTATLYPDECEIGTELTGYAEACCNVDGPAIEITKEVDCDISSEGDEVIYTICVTNLSNPPATLYNVVVTDPLLGGTLAGFPSELSPGQNVCVDFPYTIQSGDPDPLDNTVTVNAESEYGTAVSDYAEETVDLIHPSFTVTKECLTDPVPAGGDADFLITITNTGDWDLWIETDEAAIAGFALYASDPVFTQTVTVTDPGGVDCVFNAINVTATLYPDECEIGTELTGYAEACCNVDGPAIEITKEVDCDISSEGDEVIYTICVTNLSNPPATLYNVVVTDPLLGGTLAGFPSELSPGQNVCVDFPYTIQSGDPDPLDNTVTVNAESEYGTAVSDYAEEQVDLIHPSFTVEKECLTEPVPSGGDAEFLITITNTGDWDLWIETDEAGIPGFALYASDPIFTQTVTVTDPGGVDCIFNAINVTATLYPDECEIGTELTGYAEACCTVDGPCIDITKEVDCDVSSVGDEVIYTICVTNCSEPPATLYNVVVSDPLLGGTLAGFPSELTPGQSVCVDFPYTIQSGDADPLMNTVTVNAESEFGTAVSDYAEETVDLIHPSFTVTKECLTDPVPVGGDADFLITITNTGDFDLWIETDEAAIAGFALMVSDPIFTQTVTVTDPGGVECIFNAINVTATLYPDECEIGTELTGYAEACCTIDGPCIEITKEVDCDISSVGDELIYSICVTNCSEPPATLYNVVVSDPLLGGTLAGFPSELTPGQSVCVDFPYTVQATDPDLENRVDVTAESEYGTAVSDYAEESVDLIHPSFEVMKECMTDPVPSGGDADFLITITNTGDFDLWIETDEAGIPGFALMVSDPVFTQTVTVTDPGGVECIFNAINVTATLYPDECEIGTELTGYAEACCPVEVGTEGCTPGYWKNHPDCWECFTPDTPMGDVFTFPSELSGFADDTLMDGMRYGGGDGLEGTVRNMLRHATAALQNGCDPDVEYPMGLNAVINAVNTALATLDVDAIHALHLTFEMYNEYGCPQNAHCEPENGDDKRASRSLFDASSDGVDLEPEDRGMSTTSAFSQAHPNPFKDSVRIQFGLPQSGAVAIDVFDVTGRHVVNLVDRDMSAGTHDVMWNGKNTAGIPMPAGVYFYRVRLADEILMKKMMMIDPAR